MSRIKVAPANARITHEPPNMFRTMKLLHLVGNFFGFLSTSGLTGHSPANLRFRWISLTTAYALLYLLIECIFTCIDTFKFLRVKNRLIQFTVLIYRWQHILLMIAFFILSHGLPKLMLAWAQMDKAMNKVYGYPRGLNIRFKTFTIGYLILCTVTVIIDITTGMQGYKKADGSMDIKAYILNLSPYISAKYPEYSYIAGIICLFIYIHTSYSLAYNDCLMVLYSTAVSLRFEQIAERVQAKGINESSKEFWIKVRADYVRLAKLFRKLNSYISLNVVISFGSNTLFFIGKLYITLSSTSIIPKSYYTIECVLLLLNCLLISVYTAWINEASKKPAAVLNMVASYKYDREIRRFLTQIAFDNIALRGGNLFRCTRNLILNMAGTIITYVLVLIQLYG